MDNPVIDQALIEKIAKLASLELSEAEKTQFTQQFQSIVATMQQVQQVNTEPLADESSQTTPLRADVPVASGVDVAEFSPYVENGFFKAPKVL